MKLSIVSINQTQTLPKPISLDKITIINESRSSFDNFQEGKREMSMIPLHVQPIYTCIKMTFIRYSRANYKALPFCNYILFKMIDVSCVWLSGNRTINIIKLDKFIIPTCYGII